MNTLQPNQSVSCRREDCRYFNNDHFRNYGCAYAQIEQKSKLSQIPPGETYSVENCQFYKPGHRKQSPAKHPPTVKVDPVVLRGANKLSREANTQVFYDMKLCDKDIAKIYEVPAQAVAYWRKVSGLGTGHETTRLNWRLIIEMMKEGYSDIAIARLVNTKAIVISEFRRTEASHNT